jgi:Domain of unknown function (DUF1814).
LPAEIDLLKFVCRKLEDMGIAYMLTGSLAANFYAVPRMTRDIDIVIEIEKPEIHTFYQEFIGDFYLTKNAIIEAIEHETMFNIISNKSVLKIDFIVRKNSHYRRKEFERKKQIHLDDMPIWIVSPEDLIISKLFWAKDSFSGMQILDIKNLLSSIKNLNLDYLHNWVRELELTAIYDEVKVHE